MRITAERINAGSRPQALHKGWDPSAWTYKSSMMIVRRCHSDAHLNRNPGFKRVILPVKRGRIEGMMERVMEGMMEERIMEG